MVVLSKMAEVLFIEALRRHMDEMPQDQSGWLAGARDKVVGSALLLLHRRAFHPWTIDELASQVGTSRTVLTDRFARFLGEPPLTYLARWRMQLAGRLLQTTQKAVLQVAFDVGYESEAAFNRAFKREFGVPPGRYRTYGGADDDGLGSAISSLPRGVKSFEAGPSGRPYSARARGSSNPS